MNIKNNNPERPEGRRGGGGIESSNRMDFMAEVAEVIGTSEKQRKILGRSGNGVTRLKRRRKNLIEEVTCCELKACTSKSKPPEP